MGIELEGKIIDIIHEGEATLTLLFREKGKGFLELSVMKDSSFFNDIQLDQNCRIIVTINGKLVKKLDKTLCYNRLYLEGYSKETYKKETIK